MEHRVSTESSVPVENTKLALAGAGFSSRTNLYRQGVAVMRPLSIWNGRPRMAKKKISSTDLIWIFHERLKAFDDHPLHGIPIAIVPVPRAGWTALTPRNVRLHRPLWENRIRAIEQELRNSYVLKG
jgi:hypothetical protein